jgi:hypothetical protein
VLRDNLDENGSGDIRKAAVTGRVPTRAPCRSSIHRSGHTDTALSYTARSENCLHCF